VKERLDKEFVKRYSGKFEEDKYPYEPYKMLVWDGLSITNKYSVLGSWKTGCIRSTIEKGYKSFDFLGRKLYFTRRWKIGTPAQKSAWEKLNNSTFKQRLLQISNQKTFEKPSIFSNVNAIDGIGFIYTLFVLHCENPRLFPLYDQHVWRAYLYFINEGNKSSKEASQSWGSFEKYSTWFKSQLKSLGDVHPTELDRALWTFGKELKKKKRPK
jgi:hypothetical protein